MWPDKENNILFCIAQSINKILHDKWRLVTWNNMKTAMISDLRMKNIDISEYEKICLHEYVLL